MSFDYDPKGQADISAADFAIMCDDMNALREQRDELLAALIEAEKALNEIRVCCHHTAWDQTGPAVIKARAAIAKATGSPPSA